MLQITADMYSGLPNPTWLVEDEQEAVSLLREISQNQSVVAAIDKGEQGLGYRGLVVEVLADNIPEKHGVPAEFRVAAAGKGLEIAERVFASMQKAQAISAQAVELVRPQLLIAESRAEASVPDIVALPEAGAAADARAVTCFIEVGAFNPGFWNNSAQVRQHNNCYNYASNRRTDTFAQPGRATGHQATVMACAKVTAGAISDGLHHRFNCFPDSQKPRWLMALVVAPGYDYHWYRKQKEGFWGHKPGSTLAKNTDNNGAVIYNPEMAARGPYTQFCGYFYACKSQKIN